MKVKYLDTFVNPFPGKDCFCLTGPPLVLLYSSGFYTIDTFIRRSIAHTRLPMIESTISDKTKRWYQQNWGLSTLLILLSVMLLCTGLSIRSLWGSEGRWAEVAREMIRSGDYFLPTINGNVYFDKPLLSYWAIVVLSFKGVVTEASSRLPSAVSGIGAVLLTFAIGRRLFGNMAGAISAMFLLTSGMFVFWSRTASSEILNLSAVWLAFWIFLRDDYKNSSITTISLYALAAIAAFCKGLVGPAVIFCSIGFYSAVELFTDLKTTRFTAGLLAKSACRRFNWVLSRAGILGVFAGSALFAALLFAPVVFTSSWQSVSLMWRENVLRFFLPFDHIEPPYVYLKYIPLFFAPWTLFLVASLIEIKRLTQAQSRRWIVLIGLAIFLFYTTSGSRRSYYILPLLPALAIISGGVIDAWLKGDNPRRDRIMQTAAIATSMILLIVGVGLVYAYFWMRIPGHISQLAIATVCLAGGTTSILLFARRERLRALVILLAVFFVVEFWGFTVGMALGEKERTLRPFSQKVDSLLRDVEESKIVLFQVEDSSLIYYLNRNPLKSLNNVEELKSFVKQNPDGYVIAHKSATSAFQCEAVLESLVVTLAEKTASRKKDDPLVLLSPPGK